MFLYICNNKIIFQVVGLNFSSATTPELLLKTFDHYCEYRRTPNGIVLSPIQLNKWLVLFCDEINLPDKDMYGKYINLSMLLHINSVVVFQKEKKKSSSLIFVIICYNSKN